MELSAANVVEVAAMRSEKEKRSLFSSIVEEGRFILISI
jgi:hypothetical protein